MLRANRLYYSLSTCIVVVLTLLCGVSTRSLAATPVKGHALPLQKVMECGGATSSYTGSGLTFTVQTPNLLIHGLDPRGKAWSAEIGFQGLGCLVYLADLARNGQQDVIVFVPGIGSGGALENHLYLLLRNENGEPTPWTATGWFTETEEGIPQIQAAADGQVFVEHRSATGHMKWGGVTEITAAYKILPSGILRVAAQEWGEAWPKITGAHASEPAMRALAHDSDLSLATDALPASSQNADSQPRLVRYASNQEDAPRKQTTAPLSMAEGQSIRVDEDAATAAHKTIRLTDGARLELPEILQIVSAQGGRRILFHPDETDGEALSKAGNYTIQRQGTQCLDAADCHPLLLTATEVHP